MDKDSLNKMLRKDVKPGTESLAINEAQSQANSLLTERKLNLETEKQVSTSEYNRDTELKAAIELGSQNQPQQVQVNQQLAQRASNLRPETQEILAKYGITPTISESNTQNSKTNSTRTSNSKSQVIPNQSGGETRVTNTTNVTNITNNNSKVETKVTTPPSVSQPVVSPQPVVAAAPVQSDNKFKTWLNGVFEKRRQEKALQDREYRRRDWEISRMTKRLTDRMTSISNSFAKRMNPENNGRTIMSQLKTILTMVGFTYLPKLWPKIISGLDSISEFVSDGFTSVKDIFNGEGGFFQKLGNSFLSVGGLIVDGISSSLAKMIGGSEGQTLGDVLADKISSAMGLENGLTLTESLKQSGDILLDGVKKYVKLLLDERADALKSVWDKQDYSMNLLSGDAIAKNFKNVGELLVAAFGGWSGVSSMVDSKMQKEAADTLKNTGTTSGKLITLGTNSQGEIVGNPDNKFAEVNAVNGYINAASVLNNDSSNNNSDSITKAYQEISKYDTPDKKYTETDTGRIDFSFNAAKNIARIYSVNDEEYAQNMDKFRRELNNAKGKKYLIATKNENGDSIEDEFYKITEGGALTSLIEAASGNKFDRNRSYKENQQILQAIRAFKVGDTKFNFAEIPRFLLSAAIPTALWALNPALGALAAYDLVTDAANGSFKWNVSTLSPAQQLAMEANRGAKEYSEKRSKVKFTKKTDEGEKGTNTGTGTTTSEGQQVPQGPVVSTPPTPVQGTYSGKSTSVDAVTYATPVLPVTEKSEIKGNNPGNIRSVGTKKANEYPTLADGYTAIFNKISRWYNKAPVTERVVQLNLTGKKVDTINKLLRIWAPQQDGNNEENYVSFVEKYTGIDRNQIYNPNDQEQMLKIAEAMTIMEHLGGKSPTSSMKKSMIDGWNNRGKSIVPVMNTTNDVKYDPLNVTSSNISIASSGSSVDGFKSTANKILERFGLNAKSSTSSTTEVESSTTPPAVEAETESSVDKYLKDWYANLRSRAEAVSNPSVAEIPSFSISKETPNINIAKEEKSEAETEKTQETTKSTPINVVNNGGSSVSNSNNVTNINISSNDPKLSFLDTKTRTYGR